MTARLRPVEEVLGAIYRVDLPDEAWLRGLAALKPVEGAVGYAACILENLGDRWTIEAVDADAVGGATLQAAEPYMSSTEGNDLVAPNILCGAQSEAMKSFPLPAPWPDYYRPAKACDVWALFARAPDARMVAISHLLPSRGKTPARAKRFWSAAAIHLTAAHRLRSRLHRKDEAVLAPDGKVLHAEGIARDEPSLEALRRAAVAIDNAKLKTSEPLAAIESWTAMVSGRWSLVDEFESDGRRFLVARVNEPTLENREELSGRERHVGALAALGRSNKEIAYELGIKPSSIASYLRRLRKKLGVRRSELIR